MCDGIHPKHSLKVFVQRVSRGMAEQSVQHSCVRRVQGRGHDLGRPRFTVSPVQLPTFCVEREGEGANTGVYVQILDMHFAN